MRRSYTIEVEFDEEITLAEQDRQVCMVLENLISDWWLCAAERMGVVATVPEALGAIAVVADRQPRAERRSTGDEDVR